MRRLGASPNMAVLAGLGVLALAALGLLVAVLVGL
jgi:hypothetical protein